MNGKSIALALTLVLGVCLAGNSHADLIHFEADDVVLFSNFEPLGPTAGAELIMDINLETGEVLDVTSFIVRSATADPDLVADIVNFHLFYDGALTGILNGSIMLDVDLFLLTTDIWFNGAGLYTARIPEFGLLTVGTTDIRVVPEPGTLTLFGVGLLGIAMMRRRRRVA